VRCGRCGNENSESNRFCGMCGAPLVAKTQASGSAAPVMPAEKKLEAVPIRPSAELRSSTVAARAATEAVPEIAERREAPVNTNPVITGPSFLGLNKPGDGRGGGAPYGQGSGNDSWGRSSRSVDYLLEDDEHEQKGGWGKLAAVVVALAMVGGFGYLRWKQGGFDWLLKDGKPAAAQASQPAPSQNAADSGSGPAATPNGTNPDNSSGNAPPAPAAAGITPISGTDAGTVPPSVAPSSGAPSDSSPAGSTPPINTPSAGTPAPSAVPNNPSADVDAGKPSDPESTKNAEAPAADAAATANNPKPDAATRTRAREPKPTPATPVDPTAEAERYIYGQGVRQDCDRGLRLLKPAAAQSNLKAMIALGALYSSGTCTPRDLPTAYRWFALALHKQPDNQPLQDDLQKLWSQMTQPERQLAIRLSQ